MSKLATPKSVALRAASTRTLKFGLVSVKVGTGPSLDSTARISAKMLDPESLTPVKQMYQNEGGEVVKPVKGYEYDGSYIVLSADEKPQELDSDGSIELTANVAQVPSEYVLGTSLVWPADCQSDEAYMLLAQYLQATGRAFIGTTVASGTTKVVAIRWSSVYESVVLQTLAYAAQVRWANIDLIHEGLDTIDSPKPEMAAMAAQLFGQLPDEFDYSEVTDEYGDRMAAAIKAKAEGSEVTEQHTPVIEREDTLLAALEASVATMASRR